MSKPTKAKGQASSIRALQSASGTFGALSLGFNHSALSFVLEPLPLQNIHDPNVVVEFKGLTKKDTTTKIKALQQLQILLDKQVEDGGTLEDGILEAWVKIYPRLSIDNDRRVRELSHTLHTKPIISTSHTRLVKEHGYKVIPCWLASLDDRDIFLKAKNNIESIIPHMKKLLKKQQPVIVEYALNAIQETPKSLSGERNVSPDDMQAIYYRVISSALFLVTTLLSNLDEADLAGYQSEYESFLSNEKVWALISCEDASIRIHVYALLEQCISPAFIQGHLELMSNTFMLGGLRSPQTTTATKLLEALQKFCELYPQIFTSSYKSKMPFLSRLESFISKGCQDSDNYWPTLSSTLQNLPSEVLPSGIEASMKFLKACETGSRQRPDVLRYAEQATSSYIDTTQLLFDRLKEKTEKFTWVSSVLTPMFEEYLYESPLRKGSQLRGNQGLDRFLTNFYLNDSEMKSIQDRARPLARVYKMTILIEDPSLEAESGLTDKLQQKIQLALPELTIDYEASQMEVIQIGRRWFALFGEVWDISKSWDQLQPLYELSFNIIKTAISTLVGRNGKPYSAAAVIEAAITHVPEFAKSAKVLEVLQELISNNIGKLILSPSSSFVIRIMFLIYSFQQPRDTGSLTTYLNSAVDGIINCPPGKVRERSVVALFSNFKVTGEAQKNSALQEFILQSVIRCGDDDLKEIYILYEALKSDCLSLATADFIRNHSVRTLVHSNENPLKALTTLRMMTLSGIAWKLPESASGTIVDLLVQLFKYSENVEDNIAAEASIIRGWLYEQGIHLAAIGEAVLKSLVVVGPDAASVSTLVRGAQEAISDSLDPNELKFFFPDNFEWTKEIGSISCQKPNPALDVMKPFPGTLNLVEWADSANVSMQTDNMGYSSLMRKSLYVSYMFASAIPKEKKKILFNLGLMIEIINDRMSLHDGGNLFKYLIPSDRNKQIKDLLQSELDRVDTYATRAKQFTWSVTGMGALSPDFIDDKTEVNSLISSYISHAFRQTSQRNTPLAYYASKALCRLVRDVASFNKVPFSSIEDWLVGLSIFKAPSNNNLSIPAILIGLAPEDIISSSPIIAKFCNEVVADVVAATPNSPQTLEKLVLLSSVLGVYEKVGDFPIPEHRSMRLIEHILSWELRFMSAGVAAESCHVLQQLFRFHPEHRATSALDLCLRIWSRYRTDSRSLADEDIPVLGMSLELYSSLEEIAKRTSIGSMTALQKEFKQLAPKIYAKVLKLLKLERHQTHVFREQVDEQLLKVVSGLDIRLHKEGPYDLYPLLASNSTQVQSAAYNLLHRGLSDKQIELALNSNSEDSPPTNLEDELISLVISAPDAEDYDKNQVAKYPNSTRGYLLAWLLIFESFPLSTLNVRSGYIEHLKRERCLDSLLNFAVEILGHNSDNPCALETVPIDEKMIRSYDMLEAITSSGQLNEMIWIVTNLYFLALSHTPYLVKSWSINEAPKLTRMNLEKWTQKYISPLLIQDTLNDVATWAKSQSELQVKISRTAREISAFYAIDESGIELMIQIPEIYTLGAATVVGHNNVIREKKWIGILNTTRAVVEFSNRSISDALDVFRKNIESSMKGVTECAICYSIVSADKKFPDKKCSTCSNKFHGQCLYKWFTTSNQNSCPLCRNQWSYSR